MSPKNHLGAQAKLSRLSAALCLCIGVAHAQSTIPELDRVVVTPARIAQPENLALGDVTLIEGEELRQAGADSIAEVLSRHAGLQITNNGGPQTATGVFLRGANAAQTLVLVDGIRINGSTSGGINWNTIDPATIERIEVLRGAASSLYGSDAIGGVINIITRKTGQDRPLSAFGNFGFGTYDTFKTSAGLSGASNGWDYSFAASRSSSQGFSVAPAPVHTDADGYDEHTLKGSLGYTWRPGQHIGLTAYNGYNRGDTDSYSAALEPSVALTRQQIYSFTSTNKLTDAWQSVLRFGFSKDMGENRDISSSSAFGSLQRSYSWQNNLRLAQGQNLSLILERLEERTLGSTIHTQSKRYTNAVGAIYRGDFGIHHVQASLRNDTITSHGSETTGGLAYDIDLARHWRAGIAGNTAFKAPTFNDLYYPLMGPWFDYSGNPNLLPEKSRNIEASLRYEDADSKASIVIYQNKIRNFINPYVCQAYMFGFCSFGRPENVDSATLRGVTLTGERSFGHTRLRASADFQDPRDDATGNQLSRRARQIYRFHASHRLDNWTLGAEYLFVGKRYEDPANQDPMGGYSLVNLTAEYAFSKSTAIQVRWNNVLDKNYALAHLQRNVAYNTPGSNVFVNLAWRM